MFATAAQLSKQAGTFPSSMLGNAGFFKLDLRLGYTLQFGARRVEMFGEIFNVTNRNNFTNPSGNQAAPDNFLILTGLSTSSNPRMLQIGARFVF